MKYIAYLIFGFIFGVSSVIAQENLQGEIIKYDDCGLDFITKSYKLTSRDAINAIQDVYVPGEKLPIKIQISELPEECFQIQKSYIWITYSNYNKDNDPVLKFVLSSPDGTLDTVATEIIAKGAGTGWSGDVAGGGKINYRLDVTDIITSNGDYWISLPNDLNPALSKEPLDGNFFQFLDGMFLAIIYRNYNSTFQGHIVINQGLITCESSKEKFSENYFDLMGLDVCEATDQTKAFIMCCDMETMDFDAPDAKQFAIDFNGKLKKYPRQFWNYELDSDFILSGGQSQYRFTVSPDKLALIKDYYSIALIGLYYRTENCAMECQKTFPSSIESTADFICPGTEVELTAQIPEKYSNERIAFNWSSVPSGFSSTEATIKVQPLVPTRYILNSVLGDNCLTSTTSYTIGIYDPVVADAGEDIRICGDNSATLGRTPKSGIAPFTFEWSPATGLTATDILNPSVQNISTETEYVLKVTDAKGCVGYDKVTVIPYILPVPEIKVLGEQSICHCESVEITAVANYDSYLWNTGETTKSIFANKSGSYSVTVTDINGCTNTSEPTIISTFEPSTVVSLNETLITAKLGDIIEIPLQVKSSENYEECNLKSYIAKISFNSTILVPVKGTPFGVINEPIRTITITGQRNGLDPILTTLKFEAVLGNADNVEVNLDEFAWIECTGEVQLIDNAVKIIDLCYEGGTRLFNSSKVGNGPLKINMKQNSNSVNIQFGILERGEAQLYFSDILGRVIKTFNYPDIESGSYELELNVSDFPPGVYVGTLRIGDEVFNQIMRITK